MLTPVDFWYGFIDQAVQQLGVDGAWSYFVTLGFVGVYAVVILMIVALFALASLIRSTAHNFIR